ncbi:hypothetical protein JI721_04945 [Alicyclobacillus cycloheptanicus]|uniref:Peptidoglycan hydrolase CwlO-like protein n=1 Tax=Alicyclobacillus cycloheptanicus TaxID=1457 RepID=A0ABT9XIT0_9BACL|nr:hypothetical protein [Alicyclobacillus cycloheptanicus]MDQ0189934.1 peptidoglycan hydrolase CwlO-like protein [Alicyclobacillus cycloheptanicus]WDM02165.1 hypothetical protein JI721_04945 [Alicyclobacillus cycloheptanicus]
MKLGRQVLISTSVFLLMSGCLVSTSEADKLSTAKEQQQQLQDQIAQTKGQLQKQQQTAATAAHRAAEASATVSNLDAQIREKQLSTQEILRQIHALQRQIHRNQAEWNADEDTLKAILRTEYEDGEVSYLSVLMNATSFNDLLSRMQELSILTQGERKLLNQVAALQQTLQTERDRQNQDYQTLVGQEQQLQSMKAAQLQEEASAKDALSTAKSQMQALSQQQESLLKRLHMTQSQIEQLEIEAQQQEEILSHHNGSSEVVVPALRYQDISPTVLYDFVASRGSAFTLSDIETICSVAQSYNINPALMLAITGQELDFVQQGTPYETWKLENPFDDYGSWAVYHTTLEQSAALAAELIQVRLSTPPPAGEDAIIWLNDPANHAGAGVYATDPNWAYGVRTFFNEIEAYVSAHS